MSLTKEDLQNIKQLFTEGFDQAFAMAFPKHFDEAFAKAFPDHFDKRFLFSFQQYIVPYVDGKIDGLEKRLTNKMNEQYLSLKEDIDENTKLIG